MKKPTARETFPEVEERCGEDPARFLDREVNTRPSAADLTVARIRGIASVERVQEWVRVEAALDRGPRKDVMALLNRRKAELEAGGPGGDGVDA